MSRFLRTLNKWPVGKPYPARAISLFYDPDTNDEYQLDLSRLSSAADPPAADVTVQQLQDLLVAGDGVTITPTPEGKLLISATTVAAVPQAPAAPTGGQVDDTADTFSFLPNPTYPASAQYKVVGRPGTTGAEQLDATNSYVSGNRIYIKVVGAVAKKGLAVYVAGSGSVPDGQALTNADPFTGATVVAPSPDLTAALAISVASLTLGSALAFTVTPGGGTGPYAYAVVATNTDTGQQFTLGSARTGNWTPTVAGPYAIDATVSDSSSPTKRAQAITRSLRVTQGGNRIPVADAGQDLTIQLPTASVALMGTASDPDGDPLTYAWRLITGPNNATGLPATTLNVVVSNLIEGTYQFGFRATDSLGAQSPEDYVLLTVNPAGVVPAAPDVNFDPVNRILRAAHALGTSELEFRRNGGPWQSYAQILTDDNGHSEGEWQFRTRAASGRPAGTIALSPEINPKSTGAVQIPGNRSTKIPLSDGSFGTSKQAMLRLFESLKFYFSNGDIGISPGGGNVFYNGGGPVGSETEFARMWTRDAYFFFRAYLDIIPVSMLEAWLDRLLAARVNGRIPDRIRADGKVERVPFPGMLESPYDNNFFYIQTELLLYKKTGSLAHFVANRAAIEELYTILPKQNRLVYIAPQALGELLRTQFYGFYDSQAQTGNGTYGAALQYDATIALATLAQAAGDNGGAQAWVSEGAAVKTAFNDPATGLWNEAYGMFRSATIWGREVHDIPGNALAVECGLADQDKALRISQKINDNISELMRGGVPHGFLDSQALPGVSLWRYFVAPGGRVFQVVDDNGQRVPFANGLDGSGYYSGADAATAAPYQEYQNLALWYTFLCEVLTTLALTNPVAARQLLYDAVVCANIDKDNGQDNVECFNRNGGYRCTQYAASAASIFRLIAGGGTDPEKVSPDPERLIQGNQSYLNSAQQRVQLWLSKVSPSAWKSTGRNTDFSGLEGEYITDGNTEIVRMRVRLMSPQRVEWVSPKSVGLATMNYALAGVDLVPADNEWTEVALDAPQAQPQATLATTGVYPPGLYDLAVRVKPGQSSTGVKDAFRFISVN